MYLIISKKTQIWFICDCRSEVKEAKEADSTDRVYNVWYIMVYTDRNIFIILCIYVPEKFHRVAPRSGTY